MIERVVCRVFLSVVSGNHEEFNASSVYREKELHRNCEHENFEKKKLYDNFESLILKMKKIRID